MGYCKCYQKHHQEHCTLQDTYFETCFDNHNLSTMYVHIYVDLGCSYSKNYQLGIYRQGRPCCAQTT